MEVESCVIQYIANNYYNLTIEEKTIQPLPGYNDKNFKIYSTDGTSYVLKIIVSETESCEEITDIIDEVLDSAACYVGERSSTGELEFRVPKLIRTSADRPSARVKVGFRSSDADHIVLLCNVKLFEFIDGVHLLELIRPTSGQIDSELVDGIHKKLGRVCKQLFEFLRTQQHLLDRLRRIRARDSFIWHLTACSKVIETKSKQLLAPSKLDGDNKKLRLILDTLAHFASVQKSGKLSESAEFVCHGDLCSMNILLDQNRPLSVPFCLLDFQDIQPGEQMVDLAVGILYQVLEQPGNFRRALSTIPQRMLRSYQSYGNSWTLELQQVELLPLLMRLRLCQSLVNGLEAVQLSPENSDYINISNRRGWELLELMSSESFSQVLDGMSGEQQQDDEDDVKDSAIDT